MESPVSVLRQKQTNGSLRLTLTRLAPASFKIEHSATLKVDILGLSGRIGYRSGEGAQRNRDLLEIIADGADSRSAESRPLDPRSLDSNAISGNGESDRQAFRLPIA